MQTNLREKAKNGLAQWGLWARSKELPSCYSQQPFYTPPVDYKTNGMRTDIYGNILTITDEHAQQIDACIGCMGVYNETYPHIARLRFINFRSYRDIAKEVGTSKDKVNVFIGEIETWLSCQMTTNAA
ncbi:hypothetical protein EYS14_01570 [Alteromonadaceae bacterium M269]|nr:hypothetical protein EYS14_01570 [Alteromonadaceae bacterium M269]